MRSKALGFTLLELMIVVVVIAILAALAFPSYIEYIRKGKRAEAVQAIGDLQLREERWRAENPTYGNTTDASATAPLANLFGSVANVTNYNAGLKNYDISISGNTGSAYVITATRKGDLANDPKCANFTYTMSAGNGTKGMSDNKNVDYCWRR
jgi:type IV pilus assembly protein PilE